MIQLFEKDTGAPIGTIGEAELTFLREHLEEETPADQDYWINAATLDAWEEDGDQPGLVALLRKALGERDDIEVRWKRT